MKNIVDKLVKPIAMGVLFLIATFTSGQWIQSDSSSVLNGTHFREVDYPHPTAAYLTGGQSTLYKSTDGRVSWDDIYDFGPFSNLSDPQFFNADTGYVLAQGGVQRTLDGGGLSWAPISKAWSAQSGIPITSIKLVDQFIFASYVSNDNTFIVKSEDYGDSFVTLFEHYEMNAQPYLFSFINSMNGFLINPKQLEQVYKTTDGLLTIDTIFITTGPISLEQKFDFIDSHNGYLYGDWGSQSNPTRTWNNGTFYFSIDLDGFGVLPLLDMVLNTEKLYASTLYGKIYFSLDQGRNWIEQSTPTTDPVTSIAFVKEGMGIAVSGNNVLYTSNGGKLGLSRLSDLNAQVVVYPNPSTGVVHLKIKNNLIINQIELFDLMGQQIKNSILDKLTIDISRLPVGVYILKLQTNKGVIVKEVIRE